MQAVIPGRELVPRSAACERQPLITPWSAGRAVRGGGGAVRAFLTAEGSNLRPFRFHNRRRQEFNCLLCFR